MPTKVTSSAINYVPGLTAAAMIQCHHDLGYLTNMSRSFWSCTDFIHWKHHFFAPTLHEDCLYVSHLLHAVKHLINTWHFNKLIIKYSFDRLLTYMNSSFSCDCNSILSSNSIGRLQSVLGQSHIFDPLWQTVRCGLLGNHGNLPASESLQKSSALHNI